MRLADSLKLEDLSHKKIRISLDYASRDPKNHCVKSSILNCGEKLNFHPTFKSTTLFKKSLQIPNLQNDHLTVFKRVKFIFR